MEFFPLLYNKSMGDLFTVKDMNLLNLTVINNVTYLGLYDKNNTFCIQQ